MPRLERALRTIGAYAGIGVLSLVAAFFLLKLSRADLRVPFNYSGDTLSTGLLVKSIIDHGWYQNNPWLGGPAGLDFHDYPMADMGHLATIRVMSLFSGDWALLINVYFLLGFPLIAISAAAVFRRFGVAWAPAIVGSLLFAFLPTRLIKGEGHLFLDNFYQVPLGVLVVLWVCSGPPPLIVDRPGGGGLRLDLRDRRSIAAILICVLMGLTGMYFAFFTAFLLVSGGVWASVERRSARNALAGLALAGVIAMTVGVSIFPTVVHQMRVGRNVEVADREPGDAETFGMKVAQLLLPVDGHRLPALRHLKLRYDATAPLVNENSTTSLGLVGSAAFLALLGLLIWRRRAAAVAQEPHLALLQPLAVLNFLAVLLATIGGLGSLVALLISPSVRTYSRMGVFIGFFAIFALVLALDWLARRNWRLARFALPIVLGVGLLDQTGARSVPPYATTKIAYAGDAEYFRRIEEIVPPRAMIFELPYMAFPEEGSINRMNDYDQIRPYLHTRTLRWTYPTMRNRGGDVWVRGIAKRAPGPMVEVLADAGAGGILLDRFGYPEGDSTTETALRSILNAAPLVSADERLAFFDLSAYDRRAHAQDSPEIRERKRDDALHPLIFLWTNGCYGLEQGGTVGQFHWCSGKSEIQVENDSRVEREATVQMTMVPAHAGARMTVGGDLMSLPATVLSEEGASFSRVIKVPPGHHAIRFRCDGRAALAPADRRTMVWRAEKFVLSESRPPVAP